MSHVLTRLSVFEACADGPGYHRPVTAALVLYLAGAGIALWRTDSPWPSRLGLAILWPIGPLAFLLTVALLLAASVVAFPAIGVGAATAAALIFWWIAS